MSNDERGRFGNIKAIINRLNNLLDEVLTGVEVGDGKSNEMAEKLIRMIDNGISEKLKILGYLKKY